MCHRLAVPSICLTVALLVSPVFAQTGVVTLNGNSVSDSGGSFLGLGVTYMSALYWAKNDRNLLDSDLAFLASKEFKYIRILSQVPGGCGDFWNNRGIHPINYTSSGGCFQPAWTDYTAQLQYLLDRTYDTFGMRTEITVFGGAGDGIPTFTQRQQHCDRVIAAIAGREHKVVHLEVANEGWQTGFPGSQGEADMRYFCQYLTDRTGILTAISAEPTQTNAGLTQLYSGSTADVATQHYSRDIGPEGGWFPVRDCWETEFASGVPPTSSNEPIGPGSSVAQETDPIKLIMAAAFAWGANLPMYVFHTSAGVRRDVTFQSMAAVGDFIWLDNLLPGNFANLTRNDGKEASAPFTNYAGGQANKWWPEVGGATSGCVRNTGKNNGTDFYTLPIGILQNGLTVAARRPMSFTAYNPLTGSASFSATLNTNQQVTIPQGPRAYIIKGVYTDVPSCAADNFTYPNGALVGNGGWYGSATSSEIAINSGLCQVWGGAGSYDAIKSMNCQANGQGIIPVTVKIYPGVGSNTMWSLWMDDTNGLNLGRWYGTATTARGRIGATSTVTADQALPAGQWSTLLANINPAANTTQFFFNGMDIGTLSHASQGAGDILGRIRIERTDNAAALNNNMYFDDLSTTQTVLVNNAQYICDTIPSTMTAGQQYNVSVTMKNIGTTTWSHTDGYKLGGVGDSDPFVSGLPRVLLNTGETVAPNAQKTFNFTMTAPTTPAVYTTDWRMLRESVEWFGGTLTKQVTVDAAGAFCFQDEFNYPDGALVGQGGWTGTALASHIEVTGSFVRVTGGSQAKNATKSISCSGSPYIWVRLLAYPGTGTATMWNVWINDSGGKNFARWYGSGTTAKGRMGTSGTVTVTKTLQGGGIWDSLVVKIDPVANTTQFFFNGADLGVYSHGTQPNNVVSEIKIERENNSAAAGNFVYLDNIRVSPN